jgi:hypothetical protein
MEKSEISYLEVIIMNEEIMNNEENIETNTEPVLTNEEDGSAAGMALLVGLGVAGTVAAQQLYRRVLKPIGGKIKAKTGFFKKKDKVEEDEAPVEIVRETEE